MFQEDDEPGHSDPVQCYHGVAGAFRALAAILTDEKIAAIPLLRVLREARG